MGFAEADQFSELIRRHRGLIHKIAFAYCRDAADREDVVQEIAVQLWRARERYDARFQETTWIYRIALNVAISYFRRERRHRQGRQPVDEHLLAIAEPSRLELDEDLQRLLAAIATLGAIERALVLLYLDGNEHAAIADVLGISVSNVGTRLNRIKNKLRVAFESSARQAKENPDATR